MKGTHTSVVGSWPLSHLVARKSERRSDQNSKASLTHKSQELETTQLSIQKELLIHTTTWLNLNNSTLSKRCLSQRVPADDSIYTEFRKMVLEVRA